MANVFDLLGMGRRSEIRDLSSDEEVRVHTEFQQEEIERSLSLLDTSGPQAERLQTRVEKSVQEALETLGTESAKRIHVISRGFCPECGGQLKQHLYTNICPSCGWTHYTVPRHGPVRVHLGTGDCIEGDYCYCLQTGDILLIRDEVVAARIRRTAYAWIEYEWDENEIEEKRHQRLHEERLVCSWCEAEASPDEDGFSIVYAAFGAYQNRYVFCSEPCREAFQERYHSRVHRNCYETDCMTCRQCQKRYDTTLDSYQVVKRGREISDAKSEEEASQS